MNGFYINPLSVNQQCHSLDQVFPLVKSLVECFEYLLPAINCRRTKLFYDSSIENRKLMPNKDFNSSINNLPKVDPDIKRLWYVYTKNRAELLNSNVIDSSIAHKDCADKITGSIYNDIINMDVNWLSFGGLPMTESGDLYVSQNEITISVKNSHNLDSFKQQLPCFQPSPKHVDKPYYDTARGEHVAAMSIDDNEAQRLLLTSIEKQNDRWAYAANRKIFVQFKLTSPPNIYHGFEVPEDELPSDVKTALLAN
jgi:hypothetical protein